MKILSKNQHRQCSRQVLALALPVAMSASLATSYTFALPGLGDFNEIVGDSDYSVAGSQGTLSITQDKSVVEFSGAGVNVANSETLTFTQSGGSSAWSVLVRDLSGGASDISGTLNGDVRVFLVNQNGFVFGSGAQVNLASLVASTYDGNFDGDSVVFNANGSTGSIDVEEINSSLANAQLVFVSSDVNIDGDISVQGNFDALAGEGVVVSFSGNDLMQFNITDALASANADGIFNISRGSEVTAANVSLQAQVASADPLSLVVNNTGVIRATGIDTSTPGVIRLVGNGGMVRSLGTLDASASSGSIDVSAGSVQLFGTIDTDTGAMTATVGEGTDRGSFELFSPSQIRIGSLALTGAGAVNTVSGLANYNVTALNAGTAGLQGVNGAADWSNNAAVTFDNFAVLNATGVVQHNIAILEGASLSQTLNGETFGSVTGGPLNDTFLIAGTVQRISGGLDGNDVFEMAPGGFVVDEIDGGSNIDTIINVFDVTRFDNGGLPDENGPNGTSSFVNWTSIENVVEAFLPPTTDDPAGPADPTPAILVPQTPIDDISGLGDVSLGLVADDNNLRLPCGHNNNRDILTEDEKLAAAEEDCFNRYGGPEYQQLISSIIHFDNDSHAITAASADRLDRVSAFVVESDMFEKIVLSGHTDDNASDAYNMKLSERRANAAADHMAGQGVNPELFEQHYFGESLPGRPNDSDENRAFNRRVHIDLKQ